VAELTKSLILSPVNNTLVINRPPNAPDKEIIRKIIIKIICIYIYISLSTHTSSEIYSANCYFKKYQNLGTCLFVKTSDSMFLILKDFM
jgi:hypothetical protein